MVRVSNYEIENLPKYLEKGWVPVTLGVFGDSTIKEWLNETPGGKYIEAYFAFTWYFEYERDALLFKLKFGSYKGNKKDFYSSAFEGIVINTDISSMYPHTVVAMVKHRTPKSQIEFKNMYEGDFVHYDYEASIEAKRK